MPRRHSRNSEQIYQRELPGGGYVSIEVTPIRDLLGRRRYRGELVVERRIEKERREGHQAPAIAKVDAALISTVFRELFPLALSNVAIAAGCLDRQRERIRAR